MKHALAHIIRLNLKSRFLADELKERAVFSLNLSKTFLRLSRLFPVLETFEKSNNLFVAKTVRKRFRCRDDYVISQISELLVL